MDVLVAFKMVPDLDLVVGEMVTGEENRVETSYLRPVVNPYDEGALELALGLRDQAEAAGEALTLTAVSAGDNVADRILKTLLALRFARAVRLAATPDEAASPDRVARRIADFAGSGGFDLLMLGSQSSDGGSGLVPALVAEALGWPCVAGVVGLRPDGDGGLELSRRYAGGRLVSRLRPPAVLVIADVVANCLRVPTLKDRMTHGKRPVEVIERANGATSDAQPLQPSPVGFSAVADRREAVMVDGRDGGAVFAALSALWTGRGGEGP